MANQYSRRQGRGGRRPSFAGARRRQMMKMGQQQQQQQQEQPRRRGRGSALLRSLLLLLAGAVAAAMSSSSSSSSSSSHPPATTAATAAFVAGAGAGAGRGCNFFTPSSASSCRIDVNGRRWTPVAVGPSRYRRGGKEVVVMRATKKGAQSGIRGESTKQMRSMRGGSGNTRADFMRPLGKLLNTGSGATRTNHVLTPLNATEELALIKATKKLKACVDERGRLETTLGRPPTVTEWAAAFNMPPDHFVRGLRTMHRASQALVNANSAFISSIVGKYFLTGVDASDLFQEGVAGFLKAAYVYDESRGARLRTFAYRTVNQAVFFAAARASTFLSSPADVLRSVFKVNNLKRKYLREGVEEPEEIMGLIARDLNMSLAKTTLIERAARPALFAESSLGDYVDNHRCRLASEGEMVPTPKEYVSTLQLREYIEEAMLALDPLERDVLRLMKGLDDGVRRSPTVVARMLQIKKQELERLETRAMAKLTKALEPSMADALACARDSEDRDRQGMYTAPFLTVQPVRFGNYL